MEINADFDTPALIRTRQEPWVASPMAGVDRRMLDRIGDEVARATSIVRYAPGSSFSAHTHSGGEEFVVLSGVFQDEHGDYPAGTYVRNPPTSSHTPGAAEGCVIFVKLWQFAPDDRTQFRKTMADGLTDLGDGIAVHLLHQDARELVRYYDLGPHATLALNDVGGTEVLVLDGQAQAGPHQLDAQDWLRLPDGDPLSLTAGDQGARLWIKTGHLRFATAPTQAA